LVVQAVFLHPQVVHPPLLRLALLLPELESAFLESALPAQEELVLDRLVVPLGVLEECLAWLVLVFADLLVGPSWLFLPLGH
jgi:hypothetical protein